MRRHAKPSSAPIAREPDAERYPYLGEHVEGEHRWVLERDGLQATVELASYKSAMLLQVTRDRPMRRGRRCPAIQYPSAWLRGDDLDRLIQILRQAKKIWLRAYRKKEKARDRWEQWLTRREAAEMLNVDPTTIDRWEERGLLRSKKKIRSPGARYDPRGLAAVATRAGARRQS